MKSKLGALVLAGGMLVAGAASADDPNPEVAKIIAQIEARRVAKAAVETTPAYNPGMGKGGELRRPHLPPGASAPNPGPGAAAPAPGGAPAGK